MTDREPRFWDYVKAAFWARTGVKGLGGMPLNVLGLLAAGVAGVAIHPALLLIAAGVEVGWLAWLSGNRRFRGVVRGQWLAHRAVTQQQRLDAFVAGLPVEARARWRRLQQSCAEIRDIGNLGGVTAGEVRDSGLQSLLAVYARLLVAREALLPYVTERRGDELKQKVEDLEGRIASAETEAVKRSLEANAEIVRQRIQHHENARRNLQVVESELERAENQVALIREDASVRRDPAVLSDRIDAAAATVGDVSKLLVDSEDIFSDEDPLAGGPVPRTPTSGRVAGRS